MWMWFYLLTTHTHTHTTSPLTFLRPLCHIYTDSPHNFTSPPHAFIRVPPPSYVARRPPSHYSKKASAYSWGRLAWWVWNVPACVVCVLLDHQCSALPPLRASQCSLRVYSHISCLVRLNRTQVRFPFWCRSFGQAIALGCTPNTRTETQLKRWSRSASKRTLVRFNDEPMNGWP